MSSPFSPPANGTEYDFALYRRVKANRGVNTTANRPTNGLETGDFYFDTTLGKPIWWDGSGWVDATGASA